MSDPVEGWVADGTTEAEPVTESTPAEAPPVEAAPEVVETAETAPVETAEAPETPVQAFIDARLNGEVYELPEGVELGLKRGEDRDGTAKVEYVPILDVHKNGMMERDYRHKTTDHANTVREFDARRSEFTRAQAALETRTKFLDEQEQQIRGAITDPTKAQEFAEHLRQYESNPMYRANVDTAQSTREVVAERDALREDADQRVIADAVTLATGWIDGMAAEFPEVSPERVRTTYAQQLTGGAANLDPSAVRGVYQAEADYLKTSVSPLQRQIDELTAKFNAKEGVTAAETHNEDTQHKIDRAKAPKVNTGRGAPTTTPVEPTKFEPRELPDRISAWNKAG